VKSPIYWHPDIYHLTMKLLYGKYFEARYKSIDDIIPLNSNVVELCAGDGYLYEYYFKKRNINYTGFDINSGFVDTAKKKMIPISLLNILTDPIPSADYVIIQAGLYQFIPKEHGVIRRLLDSAKSTLIIAEPIRNLADSTNPLISLIAKYSANPGSAPAVKRFNRETLINCFRSYKEFHEIKEVEGGRELIGIFKKQ